MDGSGQRRLLLPTQETYSSTEHSAYIRSILVFRSASSSPSKGSSLIGSSHRCLSLRFNCKFLTHLGLMDVPITTGVSFSHICIYKKCPCYSLLPFFPSSAPSALGIQGFFREATPKATHFIHVLNIVCIPPKHIYSRSPSFQLSISLLMSPASPVTVFL